MTVDPRSLNYPGIDSTESSSGAENAGVERSPIDRRTGTNDELKELDRVERRKQEQK